MAVLLPDGDVREHSLPTTLGPRVLGTPLAAVPVPGRPIKGWLREICQVLPQCPRSHSTPPSPYEDIIKGFGASAPEELVPVSGPSEDVHLHPQGNASCPRLGSSNPMFNQGGSKNGRRTLKIFWEDWYAREISRFVCNKVRLF